MKTFAPPARDDSRVIFAWAMYDWANSAFTTLVVTFIYATYFTAAMAPDEVTGTTWWSRGIGISAVIIALLSPVVGAMADRGGKRLRYLAVSTVVCVVSTASLTFVAPSAEHAAFWAILVFIIANVAFEVALVFYNSFLPIISSEEKIGRASGYGWGLGYVGGLACMVVALVGFVRPETPWLGMSTAEGFNVRATNLLVAAWFLIFSLPLFFTVRERPVAGVRLDLGTTFRELGATLRAIRRYREVVKFLLARMIYNDGLVTLFAFGGIYAAGTFGMPMSEVIVFGIVLNVAAGVGALAFGFVDDRIGGKRTVLVTLVALSLATILAVTAQSRTWLWIAGVLMGIFIGPNQSASRSLMGRFVPTRHQAEFFGFFAFSGKATSFLGPVLLGSAAAAFDSQRAGVATILAFFVIGGVVMLSVDEQRGIAAGSGDG